MAFTRRFCSASIRRYASSCGERKTPWSKSVRTGPICPHTPAGGLSTCSCCCDTNKLFTWQWSKPGLTREGGIAGVFDQGISIVCNAIAFNENTSGEKNICPTAARLTVHTVEYDHVTESQLASRNHLQGRMWCKFGHVTLEISRQRNPRTPASGSRSPASSEGN